MRASGVPVGVAQDVGHELADVLGREVLERDDAVPRPETALGEPRPPRLGERRPRSRDDHEQLGDRPPRPAR